jgi:hypothetical protein
MSGTEKDVESARAEAMRARMRLAATMSEIQDRLNPRILLSDAWQEVREHGQDLVGDTIQAVRAKPVATSAMAAAIIALFAREPIWRAVTTLFFRRRETSVAAEQLEAPNEPSASPDDKDAQFKEVA